MKLLSRIVIASLFVGCQSYDSPPQSTLVIPEGGAFSEGESVVIRFSERVDPDTIEMKIWSSERDGENEIPADATPLVKTCNLKKCGEHTVVLTEKDRQLEIDFSGDLGKAGPSFVLQFQPGLADRDGNKTGTSINFDVQFRAEAGVNAEPVEFDNGVYIMLAQVEVPLPAVLTLIADVRVKEDGRFAMAGAEGDEINGAPQNTRDPENLVVDETDQGYTIHTTGFVTVDEDGKRTLETDPVTVTLPAGPLNVEMYEVRLFADIVSDENGNDSFDGSLSFESMVLINTATGARNEQPGNSTALVGDYVPPGVEPEGHPEICGDMCGLVEIGLCEPPESFPGDGFCEE